MHIQTLIQSVYAERTGVPIQEGAVCQKVFREVLKVDVAELDFIHDRIRMLLLQQVRRG